MHLDSPSRRGPLATSLAYGAAVLGLVIGAGALAGNTMYPRNGTVAAPTDSTATVTATAVKKQASALPTFSTTLDRLGDSVPLTNYSIPAGAIFISTKGSDVNPGTATAPVRTLNQAVAIAPVNGTIVFRGGEYRDWYHNSDNSSYRIVDKSLTFQAYPKETVWLNGSDVVPASRWLKASGRQIWSTYWSTPQFCDGQYYVRAPKKQVEDPNSGPCSSFDMSLDRKYPMAGDPQGAFANGASLRQVAGPAAVRAGTFYYDWNARRLYVGVDPARQRVEVTARPVALVLGNHQSYKVLGLGFRRYASNQFSNLTRGALTIGGSTATVENSVFKRNSGGGLTLSNPRPGSVIRKNVFALNGYTGLQGNGGSLTGDRNDLLVDGNVFYKNNADHFGTNCSVSCGQAAAKFAHMVGMTLSHNLVEQTQGSGAGLWCDLDCTNVTFIYNTIRDNPGGAGIVYEVSDNGIIAANVVKNAMFGIAVSSANTKIYNNTLIHNHSGIKVVDDRRTRGRDGWVDVGPDTRNVAVVNNVVDGPYDGLTAIPLRPNAAKPNTGADTFFSRVDHNTMQMSTGHHPIFVIWQARTGARKDYRSRARFLHDHGLERSGQWLIGTTDRLFVQRSKGDYRIRPSSPAYGAAADLPKDVAAALKVPARDPHRSRGAFRG